jgi:hypothetical protein
LPDLAISASTLMNIAQPNQALMIQDICDILVPATSILRDMPALRSLRAAFTGRIRLIVNEACLPGCPFRIQHFYEMGSGFPNPHSLCDGLLRQHHRVLDAYIYCKPLSPRDIGGGPASVLKPVEISEGFFAYTLECGRRCHECYVCREYYEKALRSEADPTID